MGRIVDDEKKRMKSGGAGVEPRGDSRGPSSHWEGRGVIELQGNAIPPVRPSKKSGAVRERPEGRGVGDVEGTAG